MSNPETRLADSHRRRTILYLCHRLPYPPDKGDRIRAWHFIERLAHRHDVYLAAFVDEPSPPSHLDTLRRTCREVVTIRWNRRRAVLRAAASLLRGRSLSQGAYESPAMYAAVARLARAHGFDAVVAFSSSMAPYAFATAARRRVLDYCDADSHKWREYAADSGPPARWLWDVEARRLRAAEIEWARRADAVVLVHDRERDLLADAVPFARLHVVGNGVDPPCRPIPPACDIGPHVGFVGALDYRPNVDGLLWFVRDVWPRVRAARPDAALHVIGRAPVRAVRRLDRRDGIRIYPNVASVIDCLASVRLGIAPLRIARGVQNKVLEMLAHGRPAVVTPAVAAGLSIADGRETLIAGSPADFAQAVLTLVTDDDRCRRMARQALQTAAGYAWAPRLREFERFVTGLTDTTPRRGRDSCRAGPKAACVAQELRLAAAALPAGRHGPA